MQTKLAHAISIIFHPLLIPTYAFLILFSINAYFSLLIPYPSKLRILSLIFIITFVFPTLVILFFKSRNIISSLQMKNREERVYPYIVAGIFFSLAFYLIRIIQISPIFQYFCLGSAILLFIAFLINFLWKISIHMIAIGGLTGMILGLSFMSIINNILLIYGCFFVSGLIGFARLRLNAHSNAQIYAGYFLGLFGMVLLALYF